MHVEDQGSWGGGGGSYGAIKEGEGEREKKEQYELSSALNVGSSLVHVIADLGRSLVIFSAGVAIVVGVCAHLLYSYHSNKFKVLTGYCTDRPGEITLIALRTVKIATVSTLKLLM